MPRPNTSESLKRNVFLSVPLRPEEKRQIEKIAEREGVSQATWSRNKLLAALKETEKAA